MSSPPQGGERGVIKLGLRQNLAQFMLLVAVNVLIGGTLGQERTVLPLRPSRSSTSTSTPAP